MNGLLEAFLWFANLTLLERMGLVLVIMAFAMILAVLRAAMEVLPPAYVLGGTAFLYVWFKTRPTPQ